MAKLWHVRDKRTGIISTLDEDRLREADPEAFELIEEKRKDNGSSDVKVAAKDLTGLPGAGSKRGEA